MTGLSESQARAQSRFIGGLLVAIGGLIATLCGLCTAAFVIGPVWYALSSHGEFAWPLSVMGLVIGGLPTAGGVTLIVVGLGMIRRNRDPAADA